MILRIFRGLVRQEDEPKLVGFIRDDAIAIALRTPGLISFQPAVRRGSDSLELVMVSTWSGFEDLLATGRGLDTPVGLPDAHSIIRDGASEHFELVVGGARSFPLHHARLRIVDIPLQPQREASYFERARRSAETLLDRAGMVAFNLGRRSVGPLNHVVAVTLWEDQASIDEQAGPEGFYDGGLVDYWAGPPTVEQYDALTATEPDPDAPAILLADDIGRYVHATPAAAELVHRPLAQLLTMRVVDIAAPAVRESEPRLWETFLADGTQVGDFELLRPDGSTAIVHYAAKTNTPWPRCHASLLSPADRPADTDLEAALSRAGFLARYGVAH